MFLLQVFLTARSLEQIKNDIAYSNYPVTLVGISAGVSYGQLGSTHHSIHDLAVLRTINNIDIVVPADNFETKQAIINAVNYPKPLFIRFGKKPMLKIHNDDDSFTIGKGIKIREGKDILFITTGETAQRALLASDILHKKNIFSSHINMHTLKPFDDDLLLNSLLKVKAIISVEEHSESGGLGEKCASIISQHNIKIPFKIIGFPDEYMINGSQSDVLDHYNMSPEKLANIAENLINKMYISLDQSTSSTTVFLYNNKLKLLQKASKLHKQIQKKSGFVEHDANEIYNNVLILVKKISKNKI